MSGILTAMISPAKASSQIPYLVARGIGMALSNPTVTWIRSNLGPSVFQDTLALPSNAGTAVKLVEGTDTSGTGFHGIFINQAATNDATAPKLRWGVVAKAAGRNRLTLSFYRPDWAVYAQQSFDLIGGQVGGANAVGGATCAPGITSLGDGWYYCYMAVTGSFTGSVGLSIALDNGTGAGAISVNYTGDNTSGVYIGCLNLLPDAAVSIKGQVFFDDFLTSSSIDLSNSRSNGYNWYLSGHWPKISGPLINSWAISGADSDSSNVSVSNSIVTLQANNQLWSAAYTGDGSTYTGTVFGGPMFIEYSLAYDPSLSTAGQQQNPGVWMQGIEYFMGRIYRCLEVDVYEPWSTSTNGVMQDQFYKIYWDTPGGLTSYTGHSDGVYTSSLNALGIVRTNQNVYQALWVPSNIDGVGTVLNFVNNTLIWTALSFTPDSQYAYGDGTHMMFMIKSGADVPVHVDYVRVSQ